METRRTVALLSVAWAMAITTTAVAQDRYRVASPDGRNHVIVGIDEGKLYYSLIRDDQPVVLPSQLGFEFRDAPSLRDGLRVTDTAERTVDQIWTQVWGEVARVRDHHNELRVSVAETAAPARRFTIVFRAFDDGIGFRYELPAQPSLDSFAITNELTEFHMADNARSWWIPAHRWNRYEFLYSASPVSMLDTVHTPLTMEMSSGLHVVIHEANLVDYAAMNLLGTGDKRLRAWLAPYADGVGVYGRTPLVTPWRTIQVAEDRKSVV